MSSARRGSALRAALVAFAWILSTGGALAVEPWEFSSPEKRASAEKQCKGDYDKAYAMAEDFLDDMAEGKAYAEDLAVECLRTSIALWESSGETKIPRRYAPYYHLAVIFDGKKQYANAKKCLDRERNLSYVQGNKELAPRLKELKARLKAFAAMSEAMGAVHELQRWNDGAHAMPISPESVDALRELEGLAERAGDRHADTTKRLGAGIDGVLRDEVLRRQNELDALGASALIAASARRSSLEGDLKQCTVYDPRPEAAVNSLRKCDAAVERVRDAAVRSACGRFEDGLRPAVCEQAKRAWPGVARLAAALDWKPEEKPKEKPEGKPKVVVAEAQVDIDATTTPAEPPPSLDVPSDALRRGLLEALTSYRAGDLDRAIDQARRLAFEAADEPARGRAVVHATVSCFLFAKWKASPGTGEDVKSWLEADARENARQAVALDPGFRPAPGLFPEPFLAAFADWTGGAP